MIFASFRHYMNTRSARTAVRVNINTSKYVGIPSFFFFYPHPLRHTITNLCCRLHITNLTHCDIYNPV